MILDNTTKLGIPTVMRPADMKKGNQKLNIILASYIFNAKHGLEALTEEQKEEYEKVGLMAEDNEGTKEERSMRLWANSLALEDVNIMNLYEEARDG